MSAVQATGLVVLFVWLGAAQAAAEGSAPTVGHWRGLAARPAAERQVYCGFGHYTGCPLPSAPPCLAWACVGLSPDNTGDYSDYF
jgi:hypothetical protein